MWIVNANLTGLLVAGSSGNQATAVLLNWSSSWVNDRSSRGLAWAWWLGVWEWQVTAVAAAISDTTLVDSINADGLAGTLGGGGLGGLDCGSLCGFSGSGCLFGRWAWWRGEGWGRETRAAIVRIGRMLAFVWYNNCGISKSKLGNNTYAG